jgi:hypothetical protein
MALGRTLGVELDVPTYQVKPDSLTAKKYPRSDFHSLKRTLFRPKDYWFITPKLCAQIALVAVQ